MSYRWLGIVLVIVPWGLTPALAQAQSGDRVPILIDTDIGAEIDDAFALGLAFGSHELDVLGITTVGRDTHQKAMMICRFLTATGRRHTQVAAGRDPQPSRPVTDQHQYYYHPDVLFDRTKKPEQQSAVDFLYRRLKQQPQKVTIVALGPLTNLARLLDTRADSASLISRIIILEANVKLDVQAAKDLFASEVPLVVVTTSAVENLKLTEGNLRQVFSPGTALTRQVQALHQMCDRRNPPLGEALAVALCLDEDLGKIQDKPLMVDNLGVLKAGQARSKTRVLAAVDPSNFANWYTRRMASLVSPSRRPSQLIARGGMPRRVHVAENFDTDIERDWWMSGRPETRILPPGSRRACRSVLTHDFDDLLMKSRQMYSAIIFNPVPGPPMGADARLSFRYWLKGTDTIRVQIYSLTNGYHRHLVVTGLAQEQWQNATVDMTEARRPDGTGGPLSENERIDDIQFYVEPDGELVVDDIVLYDAAVKGETRPFPKRILFTGIFDTGKQGQHWPGDFEIVADAGNFWRAARSLPNARTGEPWIRLGLRGPRRVGEKTQLLFRYRLTGAETLRVRILNTVSGQSLITDLDQLQKNQWTEASAAFDTRDLSSVDEIRILLPKNAELLLDDLLLFEAGP